MVMFWKYALFETKLMLHNRKNWFLGLFLLLFFPFFFVYYGQSEPISLKSQKEYEVGVIKSIFNQFPDKQRDTPEGEEVYQNLLKQSSLVNYQNYYLSTGDDNEAYIENGLLLNELRLRVHALDHKGINDYLVKPEEEILKEAAFLSYLQEHELPLRTDSLAPSNYIVVALGTMSGVLFYLFVLLSGSEIATQEQRHRTVVNGFPIAFMKKVMSKISIHFIHIFTFLILGMLLGVFFASRNSGFGDFSYPVILYRNGGFEAIPTVHYLMYVLLAMALITIMLLCLSVVLNLFFRNAYANVLIGLGLFLLPDLLMIMGVETKLLNPIKYVDFSNVLSGDLANQLGNSQLDLWHACIWLVILSLIMIGITYMKNKVPYIRKSE